MTPHRWNPRRERLFPCPGSKGKPASRHGIVGICPGCGVRTFITQAGTIQPHKTTRADMVEHQRRGARDAMGVAN